MGCVKDKIISFFKTKNNYSQPKRVKPVYEGGKKPSESKIKKQSEENII